uniref:TBC domain-containing protein, putative n=1 Tax=Neospora caninum (strain Liverpool) TaxID=572307 RepID=A0A0F7UD44_NEOCL|nr:TPA: TBC domain-containing protein, putative [Neospora caninum Liverpool]
MSFLWSGSALISFSGLGGPSNTKEEDVALEEASERGTVASAPAAHLEESDGEKRGEQQWRELDEVWSGNGENREPQRTGKSLFPFVSNGSRSGPDRDWPSTTPEALPPHDAAADESGVCTPPPVAPSSGSWRQSGSLRKSNHLRGDPRFWSPPRETHASEPRQLGSGDSHSLVGAAESLSPREDAVAQGSSRMPLTYGVLGERAGESRHAVAQPGGLPPYPVPTASRSLSPTLSPRMDERISPLSAREDGDRKGNFESQMHPPLVGRPVEEGTPSREDTEQEAAPHHFGRPGIHRKTGSGDEGRGRDADVSCRDRTMAADDLPRDVKTQLSFGGSGPRRTSLSGSVPAPSESLLQQRQHNRRQQQELLQHSSSSSSSSSAFPSRLRHSSPAADPATASQERRGRWAQSRRDSDGAVAAASPSSSDHGGVEREIDGGVGWARRRGGSERPEEQEGDAVAAAAARAARRRVLLQKLFGVKNSASGERGERKWQSMEDRNLVHFMHMHRHTFFRRLRRGVPPSHRWNAWKAVCLPPPEHRCACPSSSFPTSESVDASGAPGHGFHPQSQPLISCVSSPAAGGVGSALTRTFSSPQRPLAGGPGTAGRTERECRRADSGEASFAPSQRQRGQGKEGEPLDTACGPGGNCREGRRSLATDAGRREGHDRRRLSGQEARKLTGGEEHEDAVGCCRAGGDCRRVYEREAERRSSFFALIMIDVPRTFPDVEVFDKDAQALLCRNLNAFANIHPEVGYCQGMNFIAGLLLLVSSFDEFDAFCVFRALMQRYRLKGFFQEKFPLLRKYMKVFDTLASQQLPELRQHFLDEGVLPAVYLHQWFLTLFVTSLPLRSVCVLWDFLLGEGLHGLLELAVALLKVLTRFIIHLRFEEVVKFLKSLKSSGGGCDDFKVGKMLVKQAAKVQVPDALLQELLTADLAVLMREAEEEEVAEAQARAAGVAAAAAAAAVPEDGAQGNPLVETLTEEEEGEDEAFDRGGLHRVSHHGGMWKEKRHHERSERQERGAQYGEAAALAAGRGGSHVHAQRGDCTEDESREKRTAFSPELGAAQQRVSSAFSSWDELPSPCGSRRHSVSSGKREGGDASGRERGEQQGRRGRSGTSPPRRPGGDLQDEEMQVLTSTVRKPKTASHKVGDGERQKGHAGLESRRVPHARGHSHEMPPSGAQSERERRRCGEDARREDLTQERAASRQSSDGWPSRDETYRKRQDVCLVSGGSERLALEKGVNREAFQNETENEGVCSQPVNGDLFDASVGCPGSSCPPAASLPQAQPCSHPLPPRGEEPAAEPVFSLASREQPEFSPSSPMHRPRGSSPHSSPFPSLRMCERDAGETEEMQQAEMLFESSPLHSHLRLQATLSPLRCSRRASSGSVSFRSLSPVAGGLATGSVSAAHTPGVSSHGEHNERGTESKFLASPLSAVSGASEDVNVREENEDRKRKRATTKEQKHPGRQAGGERGTQREGEGHETKREECAGSAGTGCSESGSSSWSSAEIPASAEAKGKRNGEAARTVQEPGRAGGAGEEFDRHVGGGKAASESPDESASPGEGRRNEIQPPRCPVSPGCAFPPDPTLRSAATEDGEKPTVFSETRGRKERERERTGEEGEDPRQRCSSSAGDCLSDRSSSRTVSSASPSAAPCGAADSRQRPSLPRPFSPRQIPLRPEGEGETLRRRASSLSDGADAEAILGSASAPVAHSATVQHARSPPSSPVDALNASPASFASEAAWQLPERADAGCRAPFAKASEVKLASPSTSFPPRSPKASSLHGREAAAALRCSGEDGRRTEATEESGRTRRERSVCAELRAHFPSACESLEAVSFVRGWSGIGNEGEESETEERRGSVSPSSRASRANRAKLPKPACGVSARGQCSFDRFPSKLRRTGTPWGKGEGAPKGEGEQRREEGGADAKDQGTEKKQAVAFGASSDGSSPLLEEPADEETTERRRNSGEALVLNAENLQDEAEREGFLPCYRLTGEEREEAIAMRLVELSPRCCKRLQTGPHLTPCNKRASTVETETSTVSSCPQLSTLSSSTPSGSPRRTRRPSSVAVPASPVVAEETPLESTGACQEQDSQRGRTGPEGDECSGGEGKQVAKSGGSKRGFVGVITRLLPVNKLALPGLSSSFFLPARSRGTAHPVEEGPAPDSPAVPDGRHADAPGQTQSVSGGAGLEA